MGLKKSYDVVVLGTGNAALCAALAASENNISVLMVEKAPEAHKGGNSYFTDGAIRLAYDNKEKFLKIIENLSEEKADDIELPRYTAKDFYKDLMQVTEEQSDKKLAEHLTQNSYETILWMKENGVRFETNENQYFESEGKKVFWGGLPLKVNGKGIGLIESLFSKLNSRPNVTVVYNTTTTKILSEDNQVKGMVVRTTDNKEQVISTKTVILACGSFEANEEKRVKYLGKEWSKAKVRGTKYNTGEGLEIAKEIGAKPAGSYNTCHAHTTDYNAPSVGDFNKPGDIYKKSSYPLGLIVNVEGKRFVDEGADFRNYTYAKYGKETLKQPEQKAFQLFDSRVKHLLREEYELKEATVLSAETIEELADQMGINREHLRNTIEEYNSSVQEGKFNPSIKDGKSTKGILPPKSNWALSFDQAPYYAYPVTCGITFTFGGLMVNKKAEVLNESEKPINGLYAAGEMVGGLFHNNYPGGSGLMSGAVFGKTAGQSAVEYIFENSLTSQ